MAGCGKIFLVIFVIVFLGVVNHGNSVPLRQGHHFTQRSLAPGAKRYCIPDSTFLDECNWCKCNDRGDNFVCTTERCGNILKPKSYG
uniref:Putative secreted protein n=1 Tax=Lutzomyia longipalpis TaxID=7200 RepID=A0A1B0CPU9_LUTLO